MDAHVVSVVCVTRRVFLDSRPDRRLQTIVQCFVVTGKKNLFTATRRQIMTVLNQMRKACVPTLLALGVAGVAQAGTITIESWRIDDKALWLT